MVKVDRFTKTYFLIDWFVVLKVAFKMLFYLKQLFSDDLLLVFSKL
ncbi:Predicted protein (fragment) [Capnocytophaga canimorsus]|uniref:Uncharacterized protein n=1 Tax=Capnocytophaga canimorsus TaxID=28188 RepID=A0A0B7IDR7_9FLAO